MGFFGILIVIAIIAGAIFGAIKGFISQLSSIVALIAGAVVVRTIGDIATEVLVWIAPSVESYHIAKPLACIILFLIVYVAIFIIATMLKSTMRALHIGFADRVLGLMFGIFKFLFVVSLIMNLWNALFENSEAITECGWMGDVVLRLAPFTLNFM